MSPRLTARIRVDLLTPSHRAAALVESAGFIYGPNRSKRVKRPKLAVPPLPSPAPAGGGKGGGEGWGLRGGPGGTLGGAWQLGGEPAQLFGVLGPRRGGCDIDRAGADQLTEAAFHGIHAILGTRFEHVSQLPRLALLDQFLDRERVEQDLEGGDATRPVPAR